MISSDSTKGMTTPPRFASREIFTKEARLLNAKASWNGFACICLASAQTTQLTKAGQAASSSTFCRLTSVESSEMDATPLLGEGRINDSEASTYMSLSCSEIWRVQNDTRGLAVARKSFCLIKSFLWQGTWIWLPTFVLLPWHVQLASPESSPNVRGARK